MTPSHTLLPRIWVAVGAHKMGDSALSAAMLGASLESLSPNIPAPDRAVVGLACEVLDVEAPELAKPAPSCLFLERIARRAWGTLAGSVG
jgi:hypothetical protein